MTELGFERGPEAQALEDWIARGCSGSSLLYGRSDRWPSSRWSKLSHPNVWLKRDDELSFTLSGPKFRKFCGLASPLQRCPSVIAIGSARSAFLLGLAQLCREVQKPLQLILLRSTPYQDFGTDVLYANAFAPLPQHWLSREQWPEAEAKARALAEAQKGNGNGNGNGAEAPSGVAVPAEQDRLPERSPMPLGKGDEGPLILTEGGAGPDALAGALSLPLDMVRQMAQLQLALSEVWIDAGSGFTAQALILGLGTLLKDPPEVHVVLCAGDDTSFALGLAARLGEAQAALAIAWQAARYRTHRPPTARAYGATNRQVWDTIARYHQDEGVLLDPLYTAKLMLTFEGHRADHPADAGKLTLLVHSGGGLNNFGFQKGLQARPQSPAR